MKRMILRRKELHGIVAFICTAVILAVSFPAAGQDDGAPPAEKKSDTVTLNVQNTEITAVLTAFSRQTGRSVVIGPDIEGKVTMRLQDTPWNTALDVILKPHGFGYQMMGDTIVINSLDKMQEVEVVEQTISKVYNLKYLDAHDIEAVISAQLSPRGSVSVLVSSGQKGWEFGSTSGGREGDTLGKLLRQQQEEEQQGFIKSKKFVVTDIPSAIARVDAMIAEVDVAPVQILIEARFLEVNTDVLDDYGINFGTGANGATTVGVDPILQANGADTFGIGGQSIGNQVAPSAFQPNSENINAVAPFNTGLSLMFQQLSGNQFQIMLHALEEDDQANILSAPRVRTLNNQEATIIVGTKFPIIESEVSGDTGAISTSLDYYQNIGIQLNVVPQVCDGGRVNMIVHPAVTAQIGTASGKTGTDSNVPLTEYPILSTREAETQIMMKSGETIVIGGMIEEQERETVYRVPILGHIPIIRWLFTRTSTKKEKMDLLIFLTATILEQDNPYAVLEEPEAPADPSIREQETEWLRRIKQRTDGKDEVEDVDENDKDDEDA